MLVALITFVLWSWLLPAAGGGLCLDQRGGRADHRLSLCARAWPHRCRSWWAMGRGATAGVLIKDADVLETLEKVDTLVVDKTGTLTLGRPRLSGVDRDRSLG